jgi:hypothetical protein
MTELVIEQLVKRNENTTDKLKKTGLVLLTAFAGFASFLIKYVILLTIALIIADYIIFRRMDIEYEYVFFNGDLDIDKIMSRELRKRMFSTNMKEVEIIAPTGNQAVLCCQHIKELDYSVNNPEMTTYEMVTMYKGEKVRVKFNPNEKILKAMKDLAPRKVIF